jgi:hypothetical protein
MKRTFEIAAPDSKPSSDGSLGQESVDGPRGFSDEELSRVLL